MQSGMGKTQDWVLEFAPAEARDIDPLMGWTSSKDMPSQVRLRFPTKDAALDYAEAHGLEVQIQPPHPRKPNIRPQGYGDNFSTTRKTPWTH